MTVFPIPPSTFEILEGRFDSPSQTILTQTLAASWQIGNDDQCFLLIFVPIRTQIGLNLILLPHTNRSIKALTRLAHQIGHWTDRKAGTLWGSLFTGMLGTNTQHIMPAVFL